MKPPTVEQRPSPEILAQLVRNHRDFLRFLQRRLGDQALAEDILQDAFVKGALRADAVRDEESAVAWFYRSLRNAVVDHHRRRGAAGRALEAFARELDVAQGYSAEVEENVCRCVRGLAETLKPEYADALRRIDVEGMSVRGYAESLGIEANNAAVRVHRAREALRKRVVACCGTCAAHGCLNCTCEAAPKPDEHDHA